MRYIGSSNFVRLAGRRRRLDGAHQRASGRSSRRRTSTRSTTARADDELVPACEHVGVDLLPYYPLASGLLTGKYGRGRSAPDGSRLARPDQADRLAGRRLRPGRGDRGVRRGARRLSMLDVAIGGLAAQPVVGSVIAGATSAEQVAAQCRGARLGAVGRGPRRAGRADVWVRPVVTAPPPMAPSVRPGRDAG